jgi:hypothetical protein
MMEEIARQLSEQHRRVIEAHADMDPCPYCGIVNREFASTCINQIRDDELTKICPMAVK